MLKKVCTVFFDFFVEREVVVHKRLFTVPNLITGIGMALIGVYVYSYVTESWTYLIPWLIIVIGLSDFFDGLAARLLNQHSYIGKIMDPVRDRFLELAIMVNIIWIKPTLFVFLIFASIILIRLLIFLIKFILKRRYKIYDRIIGKRLLVAPIFIFGIASVVFVVKVYWPEFWIKWAPSWVLSVAEIQLLTAMLFASIVTLSAYLVKLLKIV